MNAFLTDSKGCIDMFNVQQRSNNRFQANSQVIIPGYNFSCNGRITGYLISLQEVGYPSVQIWHPTSPTVYTRVDSECPLTANDINMMTDSMGNQYYLGNVSCTGNNRIEFQSGDFIGYHQIGRLVFYLNDVRYTSYRLATNRPLSTIDINVNLQSFTNRLPLIQMMFGKRNNIVNLLV